MQATDLYYLTIAEASKLVRDRRLSPVELVDAHLRRVHDTDGRLNSFVTLLADEAVVEAKSAEAEIDAGGYRGPLHGIPVGLKDLFYTRGVKTTVGSRTMADFVPGWDATVTERLKDSGAILMGKLHMREFAMGPVSDNPFLGPARNPWDTERTTGGSSCGSGSSVAAGQCMGALGSDTGGSVRIPACLCGIVGLKPTVGRVSRHGVFPMSWSFDTVGVMARVVEDAALMLNVVAGHDPLDPSSSTESAGDFTSILGQDVAGLRLGIPSEFFFDVVDAEVSGSVLEATRVLEGLGASVDEVSIPLAGDVVAISTPISGAEASDVHRERLRKCPDDMSDYARGRLEAGALTSGVDYVRAQRTRTVFNRQVEDAFRRVDILLTPTTPVAAPMIGEETVRVGEGTEPVIPLLSRLTRPFNLPGSPAITVPCGFTSAGLPIGLQLAGRLFDEATVLRVAYAYEQATGWHKRRPPI